TGFAGPSAERSGFNGRAMSFIPWQSNLVFWLFLLWLFIFFVGIFTLARRQWKRRDKDWRIAVQHQAAMEGAKRLKDWCSWRATMSTAAIAATRFLARRSTPLFRVGFIAAFQCALTLESLRLLFMRRCVTLACLSGWR